MAIIHQKSSSFQWLAVLIVAGVGAFGTVQRCSAATIRLTTSTPELERQPDDPKGTANGDVMFREVVRQTILLSAHQQFGLVISDETLRQEATEESEQPLTLDLTTRYISFKGVFYRLQHEKKVLASGWLSANWMDGEHLRDFVDTCYDWSQTELATVFTELGYQRVRSKPLSAETLISAQSEAALAEFSPLSQAAAIRMAHRQVQSDGASVGLMMALARGYSNLAQLCDHHPSSMRLAFSARAVYYANRVIHEMPDSPQGYWTRSYVFSMLSYLIEGAADWRRAEQRNAEVKLPVPDWCVFIPLVIDYDSAGLKQMVDQAVTHESLATFFWFRSLEYGGSRYLALESAQLANEQLPRCLRVVAALNRIGGVAIKHQSSQYGLRQYGNVIGRSLVMAKRYDQRIDAVAQQAGEPTGMPDWRQVATGLIDSAHQQADENPLSIEVMGRLMEDEMFAQAIFRSTFLRDSLSAESNDFVDMMMPLLKDHPHALLLESTKLGSLRDPEKYEEILQSYAFPDSCSFMVRSLVRRIPTDVKLGIVRQIDADSYHSELFNLQSRRETDVLDASHNVLRSTPTRQHYDFYRFWTPHSPVTLILETQFEWKDRDEQSIQDWFQRYQKKPVLAGAIGEALIRWQRYDEARVWLRRYIDDVPEQRAYTLLAAVLWEKIADEGEAIRVVTEFLDQPDFSLHHAAISRTVAHSFMRDGRYDEALPWAKRAAQSGSSWGMQVLGHCFIGLGQPEKAREMFVAVKQRYHSSASLYRYELATGEDRWDDIWSDDEAHKNRVRPFHLVAVQQYDEAIKALKDNPPTNAEYNALAAIAADATDDDQQRDQYLQAILRNSEASPTVRAVARLILSAGNSTMDQADAERAIEGHDGAKQPARFLIASHYLNRKAPNDAKNWFRRMATEGSRGYSAVARRRLVAMKEDVSQINIRWRGFNAVLDK